MPVFVSFCIRGLQGKKCSRTIANNTLCTFPGAIFPREILTIICICKSRNDEFPGEHNSSVSAVKFVLRNVTIPNFGAKFHKRLTVVLGRGLKGVQRLEPVRERRHIVLKCIFSEVYSKSYMCTRMDNVLTFFYSALQR